MDRSVHLHEQLFTNILDHNKLIRKEHKEKPRSPCGAGAIWLVVAYVQPVLRTLSTIAGRLLPVVSAMYSSATAP